jgi:hypothetical protein
MGPKTHKKKKVSILEQINIDKLADKIDVDNFKISDFTNVLKKYSIPSFSEENNNDVNNILQNLKSKSQKKKKQVERKPVEKLASKEEITEFFASKIKKNEEEIIKKNEEKIKTQKKKVSFEESKYSLDDLINNAKNNNNHKNNNNNVDNNHKISISRPKIKYDPNVNILLNTNIDPLDNIKKQFNNNHIVQNHNIDRHQQDNKTIDVSKTKLIKIII